MQLNDYLIDTFNYNDTTNRALLLKIGGLADNGACIRFFSHLINCQYKWMARMVNDAHAKEIDWWLPVYSFDRLEQEWSKSLQPWLHYIQSKTEEELSAEIIFTGFDGGQWAATPKDVALQLNYHSIHHRAQIQTLIREQGIVPDFVDYIGTKYKKLS